MVSQKIQIELDNNCPLQSDYQQLINSILEEDQNANLLPYTTFCQGVNIIAAYDQGKLVGLGRVAERTDRSRPCNPECELTVLKPYRNREIDSYMRKLLSVR